MSDRADGELEQSHSLAERYDQCRGAFSAADKVAAKFIDAACELQKWAQLVYSLSY